MKSMQDMNGVPVEIGDRVRINRAHSKRRPFDAYGKVVFIEPMGSESIATIWVEGEIIPSAGNAKRRFGCNLEKVK